MNDIKPDLNKPTPNPVFTYFSSLLDRDIIDSNGDYVGGLYDIIVKVAQVYPQSVGLIVRKGFPNRLYALISWQEVSELTPKEIRIKLPRSKVTFAEKHDNKDELSLRRDVLDQQVVDTYNHKVIRVNDIHFLQVDQNLTVAHVDIGGRGIVRRLGYERSIDFLVRLFNRHARYLRLEHLIAWKYIQPLTINPVSMTIKINVPQKQLTNIPSADLGEIIQDLPLQDQIALFKTLELSTRAKAFMNIDFKTQQTLIEELGYAEIATILNFLPSDEATDFLERLPKDEVKQFLNILESKQAKKLSELLGYSSDSAGGLMTTEYLAFKKGTPVGEILRLIREKTFKVEPAQFVYIVDEDHHLTASINFKRLILAQFEDPIEKFAFPKTYFVKPDSSVKEVAYLMEKYKYNAIPVVDEQNVLKGIITVDDILSQVIAIAWRRLKKIAVTPKQ
jgi:magnesium transporter